MKFADFLTDQTIFRNDCHRLEPKVSIVMPTYARNVEGLLEPCIQSVLDQTFKEFEFIIVDDGSIDGTEEVVQKYAGQDPRIVYVRHSRNCGLPALRVDEGILLSRSSYISFIFDDNAWGKKTLEVLVNTIKATNADMVYGNFDIAHQDGQFQLVGHLPLTIELLQNFNVIPNGAVLCQGKFFEQYGLYDPHLLVRRICDWDLWLRALKLGANFQHINRVVGTEHGMVSESSLGNTAKWDNRTTMAYIQDEVRLDERVDSLRAHRINDYDVFDPERVLRYVRDLEEWEATYEAVYKPYFSYHSDLTFEPPIPDNRRYDPELRGYALNPQYPIFRDRKRLLLVANRYDRSVQDWWLALAQDVNHIVVTCNEPGISAFTPRDVDVLILFDCTSEMMMPFLERCAEISVPVIYLIVHGMDVPDSGPSGLPQGLVFIRAEPLLKHFGTTVYFSQPGTPWPTSLVPGAARLMESADQVFILGELNLEEADNGGNIFPIRFIPNALGEEESKAETLGLALYLGDAQQSGEGEQLNLSRWLEWISENMTWNVYCLPDTLPADLKASRSRVQVIPTYDSLTTLARKLRRAILVVPEQTLAHLSNYHLSVLEEDLVRHGCCLVNLGHLETDLPEGLSLEVLEKKVTMLRVRIRERATGYRHDARPLHLGNIIAGVAIRKQVTDLRRQTKARDVITVVLVKNQLFGGSEAFGLPLVKALSGIGFHVKACIPKLDCHSSWSDGAIQWLKDLDIGAPLQLEYGKEEMSILDGRFMNQDIRKHSETLSIGVDQQKAGIVICSDTFAEPLTTQRNGRPTFMGLYNSWGPGLKEMPFVRDRLDGVFADCVWAAKKWAEWIRPPVACVYPMIEPDSFIVWNEALPEKPVCIAFVETGLDFERRKEVVLAFQDLVMEGFDLKLNYYAQERDIHSDSTKEIKDLASCSSLKTRVTLHGSTDLREIVRENHLIISASGEESLPQSLIIGQAAGLVPVACPAGGIEEVVREGETGFLAAGFGLDALVDVLRRSLRGSGDWPRLIDQGRKLLVDQCSEQVFTRDVLKVLHDGTDIHLAEGRRFFLESTAREKQSNLHSTAEFRKEPPAKPVQIISPTIVRRNTLSIIGPELCSAETRYRFKATNDSVAGLQFQVGTFMTRPRGGMELTVLSLGSGVVLRNIRFDASALIDNSWAMVTFDPILNAIDQEFAVAVKAKLSAGRIAVYEDSSNGLTTKLALQFERRLRRIFPIPLGRHSRAFLPV